MKQNENNKKIPRQKQMQTNKNIRVRNPYSETRGNNSEILRNRADVISGYFVKEKSYKEIIISRINTALCCILGLLVGVCLISYYFVVNSEAQLQKLSKETIALNYDNSDMQNKLDNMQSFSNVDFEVTKSNTLHRAKEVMELSAADIPLVNYDKNQKNTSMNWSLGY